MKKIMCSVKSFITFDFPLQADFIKTEFDAIHSKNLAVWPEWSTTATKQILISKYWFNYVAGHFTVILGLSILTALMVAGINGQLALYLFGLLTSALISFPILNLFHYRPYYSALFLPKLEVFKAIYERRQNEFLDKCRRQQLSNFSLTLFFYVITQTTEMYSMKCDEGAANLLMKLYGVDSGSLKKNLELIMGTGKRKNLSERKITEIRNRFSETYNFLEDLGYVKGIEKLKELEVNFFK